VHIPNILVGDDSVAIRYLSCHTFDIVACHLGHRLAECSALLAAVGGRHCLLRVGSKAELAMEVDGIDGEEMGGVSMKRGGMGWGGGRLLSIGSWWVDVEQQRR
jgi:hypothetical protein